MSKISSQFSKISSWPKISSQSGLQACGFLDLGVGAYPLAGYRAEPQAKIEQKAYQKSICQFFHILHFFWLYLTFSTFCNFDFFISKVEKGPFQKSKKTIFQKSEKEKSEKVDFKSRKKLKKVYFKSRKNVERSLSQKSRKVEKSIFQKSKNVEKVYLPIFFRYRLDSSDTPQ